MTRDALSAERSNNFDALRLYAALMVIYGHGFNMAGDIGPGLWGVPFARVGLDVFFSISGYLVTASWDATPRLSTFAVKRALRIWPALAACTILSAFVLGPLLSTKPAGAYYRDAATWHYLGNLVFFTHLYLPAVFLTAPHYVGVANGSVWSLFPEVLCYLTVPLFALLPPRARRWSLLAAGLVCGMRGLWWFEGPHPGGPHVYGAELRYILVTVPFFFIAASYRLFATSRPEFWRGDVAILFLTANWGVAAWFDWWNIPVEWLTLPYIVVTFGRQAMPILRRAARFGDLSYGTYLWAFPVQQFVLTHLKTTQPIPVCVGITLPIAFLSWHLVEKPAVRLRGSLLPLLGNRGLARRDGMGAKARS